MKSTKPFLLLSLFLLVFSVGVSAACVVPTEDLSISSDIEFCTGIYNLNDSDTNGSMIINSNDIVIDCNGSKIYGSNVSGGYPFDFNTKTGITLKNCIIESYSDKVVRIYNNFNMINTTIQNSDIGIQPLWNNIEVNFTDSILNLRDQGDGALTLGIGSSTNVEINCDNTLFIGDGTGNGLKSVLNDFITVNGCEFTKYNIGVSFLYGDNLTFNSITSHNCTSENMFIASGDNLLFNNLDLYDSQQEHGIYLSLNVDSNSMNNITLINSRIYNNAKQGIHMNSVYANRHMQNVEIYNNTIYGNTIGTTFYNGNKTSYHNNYVFDNTHCIWFQADPVQSANNQSINNNIYNNTFDCYNNEIVSAYGTYNNSVYDNTYIDNINVLMRVNTNNAQDDIKINETNSRFKVSYDNSFNYSGANIFMMFPGLKDIRLNNNNFTINYMPTSYNQILINTVIDENFNTFSGLIDSNENAFIFSYDSLLQPRFNSIATTIDDVNYSYSTNRLDITCEGTGSITYTNMLSIGDSYNVYHNGILYDSLVTTDTYTTNGCSSWTFIKYEVAESVTENCNNTVQTIFSGLGLVAVAIIVIAGFVIVKILQSGNYDIMSFIIMAIALAIVIILAYFIIGIINADICYITPS